MWRETYIFYAGRPVSFGLVTLRLSGQRARTYSLKTYPESQGFVANSCLLAGCAGVSERVGSRMCYRVIY